MSNYSQQIKALAEEISLESSQGENTAERVGNAIDVVGDAIGELESSEGTVEERLETAEGDIVDHGTRLTAAENTIGEQNQAIGELKDDTSNLKKRVLSTSIAINETYNCPYGEYIYNNNIFTDINKVYKIEIRNASTPYKIILYAGNRKYPVGSDADAIEIGTILAGSTSGTFYFKPADTNHPYFIFRNPYNAEAESAEATASVVITALDELDYTLLMSQNNKNEIDDIKSDVSANTSSIRLLGRSVSSIQTNVNEIQDTTLVNIQNSIDAISERVLSEDIILGQNFSVPNNGFECVKNVFANPDKTYIITLSNISTTYKIILYASSATFPTGSGASKSAEIRTILPGETEVTFEFTPDPDHPERVNFIFRNPNNAEAAISSADVKITTSTGVSDLDGAIDTGIKNAADIENLQNQVADISSSLTAKQNFLFDKSIELPNSLGVSYCEPVYKSGNVVFAGLRGANQKIAAYDYSTNQILYYESPAASIYSMRIKAFATHGNYFYCLIRGNGTGMLNNNKYPDFYTSFEEGFEAFTNTTSGGTLAGTYSTISKTGCPARGNNKVRITGNLSALVPFVHNTDEELDLTCWIRLPKNMETGDEITIKFFDTSDSIVSIKGGSSMVLSFAGTDVYLNENKWYELRLKATSTSTSLYYRDPNQGEFIQVASTSADSGLAGYSNVGLIVENNTNNTNKSIDFGELALSKSGSITQCNDYDGLLLTYDMSNGVSSMTCIDIKHLNLRGLSMLVENNYLYVGLLGGVNIYSLVNGIPELLTSTREAKKTWQIAFKTTASDSYGYYKENIQGSEHQKLSLFTDDNENKLLAAGADVAGLVLYHINMTNNVPTSIDLVFGQKKEAGSGSYHTNNWGCYGEYPYVYMNVSHLLSKSFGENADPIENRKYGLLVYDLSEFDISSSEQVPPSKKFIKLPNADYPTPLQSDGDASPKDLIRMGDFLLQELNDKGIGIYKMNGFDTKYLGCYKPENFVRAYSIANDSITLMIGDGDGDVNTTKYISFSVLSDLAKVYRELSTEIGDISTILDAINGEVI